MKKSLLQRVFRYRFEHPQRGCKRCVRDFGEDNHAVVARYYYTWSERYSDLIWLYDFMLRAMVPKRKFSHYEKKRIRQIEKEIYRGDYSLKEPKTSSDSSS